MDTDPVSTDVEKPRLTAQERLEQLQRELQSRVRRKLKGYELTALKRAAVMQLRAEIASLDPRQDSLALVRLDNASRRALTYFENLVGISARRKPKVRTMADYEAEAIAHAS